MVPDAAREETGAKSLKRPLRQHGAGRLFFYESSPARDGPKLREDEDDAMACLHAVTREPGDLPDETGAQSPKVIIASSTEVVMAHSAVSTVSGSLSDRLVAGVLAALLGSFLIFGAGFAHSSVLHDTAHDVRHASGFPCH